MLDGIARLMGRLEDAESSSTVLEHFLHERKSIQTTAIIQRGEDLIGTPYLYPVPCTQSQHLAHRG